MNKKRMKKLRDFLAKSDGGMKFNMDKYLVTKPNNPACGTAGCIAGHAVVLAAAERKNKSMSLHRVFIKGKANPYFRSVYATAREWLEIDADLASDLFEPEYNGKPPPDGVYSKITRKQAVTAVERVIAGERARSQIWAGTIIGDLQ